MNTGTDQVNSQSTQYTPSDFDLDVTLIEIADTASLVNVTNDGCGSTCGACVTVVA